MEENRETEILQLFRDDEWMMTILATVQSLNLPDWWVCAGFVRSKVWDTLHHYKERTSLPDIDVIYYDTSCLDEKEEKRMEQMLNTLHPGEPWSVKNQARMHLANNVSPYSSSFDAISKFPETATALGVKMDDQDQLLLAAPHGVEDVLKMRVTPTPYFRESPERLKLYQDRVAKKAWNLQWGNVRIEEMCK
ncbi:hypothetical protein NCCP2716_25950 [Sporosarcina sp. NCCP-2716]|uniref:nucleotidyltransferase family protein n=1 Tax=Sporosarcina sp. NCCP-2716 TaxID=2943679 RepID=UPI00203B644F|nr:nucleotidyltransferase family protein [Sporosarcina sp. NCCP-2716]GKV70097.1 hypothetical protein NCCP2716_25950 [Sporosarcina sp. NCCP-2716]